MLNTNVNNSVFIVLNRVQKYIPLANKKQVGGMEERFSQNFNKLYYSIGEVADIFGVNASLIRFWEKEFDAIKPKKNAKGDRKFTPKDIEIVHKIHHLVKVKGYTLDGAKKALKSKVVIDDAQTTESTVDLNFLEQKLTEIKQSLLALKA
jgi:DNA-binding transcriptional MerR regulator